MTVQELINKLNKIENKELPVLFQTTDPTDWTYVLDVNEDDVEYVKQKTCKSPHCDDLCDACEETVLKVDSDNCITIHPIKDSWTREEVEQLCVSAYTDGFYEGTKKTVLVKILYFG